MATAKRLGALVVGQSPRPEVEAEIRRIAGPDIEIDLRGSLDGLSRAEIDALPPVSDKDTLFTRLPNGDGVKLSKQAVVAHGERQLEALCGSGADVVVVLCTGDFPAWSAKFRCVFPSRTLRGFVTGLQNGGRLGILTPLAEQTAQSAKRWAEAGYDARVEALSPNAGPDEIVAASKRLAGHGSEMLVLDCMSYTRETKALACATAGVPGVLALSAATRAAVELLS